MNKLLVAVCVLFSNLSFAQAQTNESYSVILGEMKTDFAFKGDKANRAKNIELASSRINGKILSPGEIFSYNFTVGNRTYENGFKDAPVIVNGDLVDGIGGGVCQVAGTLHAAMLYSGLEIVESKQHSRMSTYIAPGLDSTVAWGSKDLKFKNNYGFPIKIVTEITYDKKRGYIDIKFLGKHLVYDTEVKSIIHYKSKIKTRRILREKLPKKYRKVIEVGTPDINMTRTRKVYLYGTKHVVLDEKLHLRYNDSTRIIEIGTRAD